MALKVAVAPDVVRPTVEPLGSTVLDHATVAEVSNFGLRQTEGLWPTYNRLVTSNEALICSTPLTPQPMKVFTEVGQVDAETFAAYGAVQSSAVGLDSADQKAEVARVFEAREGKTVESYLRANVLGAAASWTPGTAIPLLTALALAEGRAADVYAGVPTLHMPRAAATILEGHGLISWTGGRAHTVNGSKVAIGGGYDDATMLTSGKWMIYVTGEVYVERSEIVEVQQFVIPGDGSGVGSDENGLSDNTSITLAERMYRVAVDAVLGKVEGKVW